MSLPANDEGTHSTRIISAISADFKVVFAENRWDNLGIICGETCVYIWNRPEWPHFVWDDRHLATPLAGVSRKLGVLLGKMDGIGFELQSEAHLSTLTQDIVKTSEIEGELLQPPQVRSSIARRLGLEVGGLVPADRTVDGIVQLTLDATGHYAQPLTADRLLQWHALLFQAESPSLFQNIAVGAWRDDRNGPMQVISGPIGRETIHYEAPSASHIAEDMERFLEWFEAPGPLDPILYAGLSHLWFVTIHPFDDGNGRIARAVADMALARGDQTGLRFYSVSARIRQERRAYYDILERTQKGDLNVTAWLHWFIHCLGRALDDTQETLAAILLKARFWERFATEPLNARQIRVLNRWLDGFEGKLTTTKWAKLAKCSQDTAHRDILDLIDRGALKKNQAGGRSTSYSVIDPIDSD